MSLITDLYLIKKKKINNDEESMCKNFKKFKKKQSIQDTDGIKTSTPSQSIPNEDIINISPSFTQLKSTRKNFTLKIENFNSPVNNNDLVLSEKDCFNDLVSYDLPESVLKFYNENNIKSLFDWQKECLSSGNVLEGQNLIFSAPTSAGKTLISDILIVRCVMKRKKKALLVVPYISLANEKVMNLKSFFKYTKIRIGSFMGNSLPIGSFPSIDIAVCTIEKANNIVNRLIEDNNLDDLGLIVIDELHFLSDVHRGYLLELLLTKIKFLTKRTNILVQIVGMSATLPNLEEIAHWIDAFPFKTDFRPIPLTELIKIKSNILNVTNKQKFRNVDDINIKVRPDPSYTLSLALETILFCNSVLVFCSTKDVCEKNAEQLSSTINSLGMYNGNEEKYKKCQEKLYEILNAEKLKEVLYQLSKCPAKLDIILSKTISFGVAFHHAGLSIHERDIIESAFKKGTIKALFATPTLSSGVNLPARRVIVSSIKIGINYLNSFTYKQMIGRAGRKGIDLEGESILICNEDEEKLAWELTEKKLNPIQSSLINLNNEVLTVNESLKRAILEIVATGMVNNIDDIKEYLNTTFYAFSKNIENLNLYELLDSLITTSNKGEKFLIKKIKDESGVERYLPTKLGQGVFCSSLSPKEAMKMFKELKIAMNGLVLNCDLHLIYQVVPNADIENKNVNWKKYFYFYSMIDKDDILKNVANIIGISGAFINQAMMGKIIKNLSLKERHVKFYYALALSEIIAEKSLADVSNKYDINKGELQQLQQRSSSYCGIMSIFCRKLGWDSLALIIKLFQDRLFFGINQDLIDLMNISCLNSQMARCLFDSGFHDVKSIAHSSVFEIEKVISDYEPFNISEKNTNYKKFWISIRCESMNEKEIANLIILEARGIIEDLAGAKIHWENPLQVYDLNELKDTPENINKKYMNNLNINFFTDKLNGIKSQEAKNKLLKLEKEDNKNIKFDIPKNRTFYETLASFKNQNFNRGKKVNKDFLDQTLNEIDNICKNNRSDELFTDEVDTTIINNSIILSSSGGMENNNLTKSCFSSSSSNNSECFENRSQSLSPLPNLSEDLFSNNSQESIYSTHSNENLNAISNGTLNEDDNLKSFNEILPNNILNENVFKYFADLSNNFCHLMREKKFKLYVKVINRSNIYSFILKWQSCKIFSINFKLEKKKVNQNLHSKKTIYNNGVNFESNKLDFIEQMCISFGNEMVYYIPNNLLIKSISEYFKEFNFIENNVLAIAFDSKIYFKILAYCFNLKKEVLNKIYWLDPKVASWILDNKDEEPNNLYDLSSQYLDFLNCSKLYKKISYSAGKEGAEKNELCFENILNYTTTEKLITCLKHKDMYASYINIEMPIMIIFAKMEVNGFLLDEKYLNDHFQFCKKIIEKLESKIFVNGKINLNSTKDVKSLLCTNGIINKLENNDLDGTTSKNIKSKSFKISKDVLEKLRKIDHLSGHICDWRKISHLANQCIEILNESLNINIESKKKKIIGIYQHWICTGRVSMVNPNLLNLSKDFQIKIENETFNFSIRKALKPDEGYKLICADYCQLELRILASLSEDEKLIEMFKNNLDVFKIIAGVITNKNVDEVSNEDRNIAKEMCYSIIYGVGLKSLALKLKVTESVASKHMESFKNSFSKSIQFIEKCKEKCRNCGFIKTIFGRVRYFNEINTSNAQVKNSAERRAINSIIQGSASDIVKLSMIRIDKLLEKENFNANLLLQMHDELIYQVINEENSIQKFTEFLSKEMSRIGSILKINLPIKIKVGLNWSELEEYNI